MQLHPKLLMVSNLLEGCVIKIHHVPNKILAERNASIAQLLQYLPTYKTAYTY